MGIGDDPAHVHARVVAVRDAHRAHLRELFDAGTLVMSGPWTADDGALLIYDAPSMDAARDADYPLARPMN